jgi:hypothetical protein
MNSINSKTIFIAGAVVIAVGAGTYFYQSSKDQKEQVARNELFQARQAVEAEQVALTEAEKAPGAKLDVDTRLSKSVKALNTLLESSTSTRHSKFEAALMLANLYLDYSEDQNLSKAIDLLKKSSEWAETSFQKASAFYLLGGALDRAGQNKDSQDSLQKALQQGDEALKNEILLSLVRISMKNKDQVQAKTFSEKLNKESPGSRAAQEAQKLVSQN